MRLAVALAAAAALSCFAAAIGLVIPPGQGTLAQSTATIQVGDYYFCDSSFENGVCETTVNAGDTIEWQFSGAQLHSTTECGGDLDACPEPHLWDSSFMDSGSFVFVFGTPGTFLYRCQVHPDQMRGRVIVLAAAQPSPSPQASPQATATPTPRLQVSAVPSGGGVPPEDDGGALAWIAIVGGGVLVASAAALAALGLRRRRV